MSSSALEQNLLLLREQGLQAIRLNSNDHLKRIAEKHVQLFSDYISVRSRFRAKLHSLRPDIVGLAGYESTLVYLILNGLDELLGASFKAQEDRLILTAFGRVIECEILTLDEGVIPLYQVVLKLIDETLQRALLIDDVNRRTTLVKRICETQESFAEYRLQWIELEKGTRLEILPKFATSLLGVYSRPIKIALERKDTRSAVLLINSLNGLLQEKSHDIRSDIMSLELRLKLGTTPIDATRLARLREQVKFYDCVDSWKMNSLFGLGAWATKLYNDGKLSSDDFSQVFEMIVPLLGGFESLSQLYLGLHITNVGDGYGWGSWELEGLAAGGAIAGWTQEESWVALFYVVASARAIEGVPQTDDLLKTIEEKKVDSSTLEVTTRTIRKIAARLLVNPEKWGVIFRKSQQVERPQGGQIVVQSPELDRIATFWETLYEMRRLSEEQAIIVADVSGEVINEFTGEFRKAWIKNSPIREFAHIFDFFDDHSTESDAHSEIDKFGMNLLEKKEWFLPEREYACRSIAESLGKGMGESETAKVFSKMVEALVPSEAQDTQALMRTLIAFTDAIDPQQKNSYAILSNLNFQLDVELYNSERFTRSSAGLEGQALPGYRGRFDGIPFLEVWLGREKRLPTLTCVNLRELGRWHQYSAGRPGNDLELSIVAVDAAKARELIQRNPKLRSVEDCTEAGEEDAIRRLSKTVHIEIWQRFKYEILDTQGALRIDLKAHIQTDI